MAAAAVGSPDAIHLHDVVFGYDRKVPVLHVRDLRIAAGKRVFLYGPSGSGKTTLLGLITGILQPQSGSCRVLGKDLSKMSMSARDQHRGSEMGYIFQSFNLIPYLTVRRNVALPCEAHARRRKNIVAATVSEEVDRLLRRLGLGTHLDRNVKKLSTGSSVSPSRVPSSADPAWSLRTSRLPRSIQTGSRRFLNCCSRSATRHRLRSFSSVMTAR
jgi:ABC-type lipoprotein export system ATPase subunit